jgi:WD40 repeat protein
MVLRHLLHVGMGLCLLMIGAGGSTGHTAAAPRLQDSPGSQLVVVHSAKSGDAYVVRCALVNPDNGDYSSLVDDTRDRFGEFNPVCNQHNLAALAPDGSGWLMHVEYPRVSDEWDPTIHKLEIRDAAGQNPIILAEGVFTMLGGRTFTWMASWLPDSDHVLYWDKDPDGEMGPDDIATTGRLRLLGVDPVTDTMIADFPEGVHWPVLTLTPDGQPAMAISPDGKAVLFMNGDGVEETLDAVHLDGSGITTLVESGPVSICAGWSPDGAQVVYSRYQESGRTVEIVNADGSELAILAQGHNPVWSPDGQQIAFNCPVDEQIGICLIAPDGSGLRELPLDYDGQAMSVYWSPDGRKLAFNVQRPPPEDAFPNTHTYDLVIFDLDAAQTHVLTSHVSPWVRGCGGFETDIKWSPDSQWLLYGYHIPEGHAGRTVAGDHFDRLCNLEGCREIYEMAWVGMNANNMVYLIRWLPVR